MRETEKRYTTSKDVAESLQLSGWRLIEKFYDKDYSSDIYHLEREREVQEEEQESSPKETV